MSHPEVHPEQPQGMKATATGLCAPVLFSTPLLPPSQHDYWPVLLDLADVDHVDATALAMQQLD